LSVVPFDYAVMDEIHRFRNPDGQMYRCIDAHFSHVKKMGLTGTLVTANAHRDMAALLQLVDKEVLEIQLLQVVLQVPTLLVVMVLLHLQQEILQQVLIQLILMVVQEVHH
jgi:SNF2 family DNA or RNA helicase